MRQFSGSRTTPDGTKGADRVVLWRCVSETAVGEGGQGRRRERIAGVLPARDGEDVDVAARTAENAQLRELVIAHHGSSSSA